MASPLVRFDSYGSILDEGAQKGRPVEGFNLTAPPKSAAPRNVIAADADAVVPGSLSGTEGYDLIAVELVAGQTYSFAYRGTPTGGIEDPYLALFDTTLSTVLAEDDDGGAGRSSLITFTAATTGTHYLYATSFYTLDTGDPSIDTGNYTIDVWSADPAKDAPATFAGAELIGAGTTFGFLDSAADVDTYRIDAKAGQLYTFTYAGGIAGSAELADPIPGDNIGVIDIFDARGTLVASAVDYETGASFFAEQAGTYYVQVSPYDPSLLGGYTLDVSEIDPADYDPLDSIDWRDADNVPFVDVNGVPTAYVYFAPAGENFGETGDDGVTPMETFGWQQFQIDGVMNALNEYEKILGANYEITTDPSKATFRLLTTESEQYGAFFYPRDPAYGTQQGIGAFNLLSGGFTLPESLQPGGYSYGVILHEFGHAHGLAHPHDTGGGSDLMLGVSGPDSLGVYDLNQGVYTVMSYNDGWETHPDGALPFTRATVGYGWSGSLSAFDIAQLQERYGVHEAATGNTTYTLDDVDAAGTFYQTIWDTGGTDTIRYDGARDARIDLLAATLDYTPTGGGVVSYVDDIHGGYTIANDVVIENATGGAGNDALLGNSAKNVLTGNAGNDALLGREGNDRLYGGAGEDTLTGGTGLDLLFGGAGNDVFLMELDEPANKRKFTLDVIGDFAKGDRIDLSGIDANLNRDGDQAFTMAGKFQLLPQIGQIKTVSFGSVSAAERSLGFDLGDQKAAAGHGAVTVLLGEVDGDILPDFAVLMFGSSTVGVSDLIL
ncbi:M10 family metallopeptidase C-terminal domain-containing protein [Sphingomonas jatrophae]|uniref:Pre-peptidase C-terminal domain-containing protein n=1 Tax=Sphingomonas jatrophae TaxID=1166337 RepID=A0A1I6KZL7_9SPHN|nr:M10 family metallopeptidase C-terminal domain-containing protein [Sphingomonas jatrophae]SFR96669.1 pre-peptidase C-terminal domain-containing protein [Sphingomonas jatrophae]